MTYNGVTFSFWQTRSVEQRPVYDSQAGVDYLYTEFIISGSGIVSASYAPSLPGETAAQIYARINHHLNTPRRPLTFSVNGQPLISVGVQGGDPGTAVAIDANMGPVPDVSINQIVGEGSFRVDFTVKTYIVNCGDQTSSLAWLSCRWSDTAEIDQMAMTRVTRTGQLVMRSDVDLKNADQLRGLVVPPLERDFIRTSSRYTLDPAGIRLNFEMVDVEQYVMPPNPSMMAEGRFSITSTDGAAFWAECSLKLRGAKTTDKTLLMQRAIALASAKIGQARPVADLKGGYMQLSSFSEDMMANEVDVAIRALVAPAQFRLTAKAGGAGGVSGLLGGAASPRGQLPNQKGHVPGLNMTEDFNWLKVPSSWFDDTGGRPDAGWRGSAKLELVAAALQDPCLRMVVRTGLGQLDNQPSGPGTTQPALISIQAIPPDEQNALRGEKEKEIGGIYTTYEISDHRHYDFHTIALPVAKEGEAAAIIRTAAPTLTRRVEWAAVKTGSEPIIPDPQLNDQNWVLLDAKLNPGQVEPGVDGVSLKYQASGLYIYAAKKHDVAAMRAALPPWVTNKDHVTGALGVPYRFSKDIIDTGSQGAMLRTATDGRVYASPQYGGSSMNTGQVNLENK